ncbi:MAG: Crp/Fnr family transcriptional regulator [Pyrinomonadaceae bacterium]
MNKNYSLRQEYLPKDAGIRSGNGKLLQNTVETIKRWTTVRPASRRVEAIPFKTPFANFLLAGQTEKALARLMPHLERVTLASDEYIYQPDDNIDFIYFPETTVMSEFQILEDGRTVEIAMIGREGIAGHSAVFCSQPAMNWTQISVAGSALKINSQILREEFNQDEELRASIFDYVNHYIGQISQRVICNSYHTVEKRMCSWLLMLQDRNKSSKIQMTQEHLARFLGVHRPSITQIAQTLRRKNLISYVRGNIFIINRPELEKAACECYEIVHRNSLDSYLF